MNIWSNDVGLQGHFIKNIIYLYQKVNSMRLILSVKDKKTGLTLAEVHSKPETLQSQELQFSENIA